jgi:hypothetical protein
VQQFGLGAIDQISFAVANIDDAAPRYSAMFGGPFTVIDVDNLDVVIGGALCSTDLRLAIGRTSGLEVELVEVVSGSWPTVDWLATRGEGLHHIRFPVTDVVATRDAMLRDGAVLTMQSADRTSFCYLESPLLGGMTIELVSGAIAG